MSDSVLDAVRAMVARAAGMNVADIDADGLLLAYGIDSIRAVDLLDEASAAFGVELTEKDLARFYRVKDIALCIGEKRQDMP
jgi:acyl carrier protein